MGRRDRLVAFLALLAATALTPIRAAPRMGISLPFVGAFGVELGLYLAGFVLPGGEGGFTAAVVGQVFAINLIALIGVLAVYQLALAFGLLRRREDAQQPIASVSRYSNISLAQSRGDLRLMQLLVKQQSDISLAQVAGRPQADEIARETTTGAFPLNVVAL